MKEILLRIFMKLAIYNTLNWVPGQIYIKILWWLRMDYPLKLKNPETFNEKLQWLKLNCRDLLHTTLADKFAVRKYISDTIGDEYLIPLVGIYDRVEDIEWEELPDQFVLKCNHDSGSAVICKDKSLLDKRVVLKKLSRRLRTNSTYNTLREWPYKNIKRKIICEAYMEDESGELIDYKFFCFNGEPRVMLIVTERFSGDTKLDYYDLEFKHLDITIKPYKQSEKKLKKPGGFNEMIRLSGVLSQNMPHVRVDFYESGGNIYFGELTFFDSSGFNLFVPESIDKIWGSWIKLPGIKSDIL